MEQNTFIKPYDSVKLYSVNTKQILFYQDQSKLNQEKVEKTEWFGIDVHRKIERKSLYQIKDEDLLVFTNFGLKRNLHSELNNQQTQEVTFCKQQDKPHKQDLWQLKLIDSQQLATNQPLRLMHYQTKKYLFSKPISQNGKTYYQVGCLDLDENDNSFKWIIKDLDQYITTNDDSIRSEKRFKHKKKSQSNDLPQERAGSLAQYENFFEENRTTEQNLQSKKCFFFCCNDER